MESKLQAEKAMAERRKKKEQMDRIAGCWWLKPLPSGGQGWREGMRRKL
jgi:hypothetical protein